MSRLVKLCCIYVFYKTHENLDAIAESHLVVISSVSMLQYSILGIRYMLKFPCVINALHAFCEQK